MTLPAGTRRLQPSQLKLLSEAGVTEEQLAKIAARLDDLSDSSAVHERQLSLVRAQNAIQQGVAAACRHPENAEIVLQALVSAAAELGSSKLRSYCEEPTESSDSDSSANQRLLDAFRQLNKAASDAQTAYRQLPKGEQPEDETVLEYQRTWFSYQAVVDAVRGRDAFHRPGGWTALKSRVMVERRRWRKGEPVSDGV